VQHGHYIYKRFFISSLVKDRPANVFDWQCHIILDACVAEIPYIPLEKVSKIQSLLGVQTFPVYLNLSQANVFYIFGYSQKDQYMMEQIKHTFDQAEIELLKEGLKRTYKERFEMATRLYKVQQTMKNASITHRPFISKSMVRLDP